ncbi:hypothetical protein GEMRC1_000188 [Eukaryota sp. GEM-RC1]
MAITTDNELAICNAANSVCYNRRCAAHVLNIWANDFIEATSQYTQKVLKFVVELHRSHSVYQRLKAVLNLAGHRVNTIPMYVCTKWNSFCETISTFVKLNNCIDEFLRTEPELLKYLLLDTERIHLNTIVEFLGLLKDATDDVESESSTLATSTVALNEVIQAAGKLLTENQPHAMQDGALRILNKWRDGAGFRTSYQKLLYDENALIGAVLDPRVKNDPSLLPVDLLEVDPGFRKLNQLLNSNPTVLRQVEGNVQLGTNGKETNAGKKRRKSKNGLFSKVAGKKTDRDVEFNVQDELRDYFSEGKVNHDLDPVEWWRNNQEKYPKLSCIAKNYLSIQTSSAPSERLFSAANHIISKKRARLSDDTARYLLCLRSWYSKNLIEVNSSIDFE